MPVVEACSDCSKLASESVEDGLLVDEGIDTKWAVGNVPEGSVFDSGVRGGDPDGRVTLAEGETGRGETDGDTGVTDGGVALGGVPDTGVVGVMIEASVMLLVGKTTSSGGALEEVETDGTERGVTGVEGETIGSGETDVRGFVLVVEGTDSGVTDEGGTIIATGRVDVGVKERVGMGEETGTGVTLRGGDELEELKILGVNDDGTETEIEDDGVTTITGGKDDGVTIGIEVDGVGGVETGLVVLDGGIGIGEELVEGVKMRIGGEDDGVPEGIELYGIDVLGVDTETLVDGVIRTIGVMLTELDELDIDDDKFEETEMIGVRDGVLELGVMVGGVDIKLELFDTIVIPQPSIVPNVVIQSITGSGPLLEIGASVTVAKPPRSRIALPNFTAAGAVVQITS